MSQLWRRVMMSEARVTVRSRAVVLRSVHRQVVGAVEATAAQSTHSHTPTNRITAHTHTFKGLEKEIELCMFYYFSPAVLKPGQSCNGVMYISLLS